MIRKPLVLDANILISAVLGNRIRHLINSYSSSIAFWLPHFAFDEAKFRLVGLGAKKGLSKESLHSSLDFVLSSGTLVSSEKAAIENDARRRMRRDPSDWPILAAALELDCPIWTDDQDFFGCGVATWKTDNVEIYLSA